MTDIIDETNTLPVYRKARQGAPRGFFECEGRGLQWLGEAMSQGGPRVVKVLQWSDAWLDIERITPASPTPQAAYEFGMALARLHDSGAPSFGAAPRDYTGTCYFGPLQDPVPMPTGNWQNPAEYLAQGRLIPMVKLGIRRGTLQQADLALTERVIDALPHLLGSAKDDTPARVHGDLWSGNLMFTRDQGFTQAVLIDPAAHGGHREEDLAMLQLFGMSYYAQILQGYQAVHQLATGYERRTTIWQLYPIAGHCVFFGGGYVSEYRSMCRNVLQNV